MSEFPLQFAGLQQAVLRARLCSCTGPSAAGLSLKTQCPVGSCIMFISSQMRSDTGPQGTTLARTILQHCEAAPHLHQTHYTAPACTPPCIPPCIPPLHHMDTLHHTHTAPPGPHSAPCPAPCPAPHRTTLACTMFALHHTLDLVLHPAPLSPCTRLHHIRLHHTRTTLACTTSALHHTRMYHIRPAPQVESHRPGSAATNLTDLTANSIDRPDRGRELTELTELTDLKCMMIH